MPVPFCFSIPDILGWRRSLGSCNDVWIPNLTADHIFQASSSDKCDHSLEIIRQREGNICKQTGIKERKSAGKLAQFMEWDAKSAVKSWKSQIWERSFLSVKLIIKFDQTKESRKLNSTRRALSNIIHHHQGKHYLWWSREQWWAGERRRDLGITILFISVFK